MKKIISQQIIESSKTISKINENCLDDIFHASEMIINLYKKNKKLLLCGNGGSAAQAQHIAAEMINKFRFDRDPLPAIALTTDTSNLTSISNDSGFIYTFSKQVEALGNKGDALIVITTSDISTKDSDFHSRNLGLALETAKSKDLKTIGLVSTKTKKALPFLDVAIKIPSMDTPRIQEGHITALHIICDLVEQTIFKKQ
jgi:D-sedoheptulose 7-phosphate isomerase